VDADANTVPQPRWPDERDIRIEQGSVVMITDKDVTREYFKETGGPDAGLVVLDSLKAWQAIYADVMGPVCVTWGRKQQMIEAQAIRDYFAAQ
jgi:hypothetical protein